MQNGDLVEPAPVLSEGPKISTHRATAGSSAGDRRCAAGAAGVLP
jgi:hypothetical protein